MRVLDRHLDDPELTMPYKPKRPKLAKLTDNKVRLKLSYNAFAEACKWIGDLTEALGVKAQQEPWLTTASADIRAVLTLLIDVYGMQMQPYALACPEQGIKLTLSRCEAHLLWKCWMLMDLPGGELAHIEHVMSELHQLLTAHSFPRL